MNAMINNSCWFQRTLTPINFQFRKRSEGESSSRCIKNEPIKDMCALQFANHCRLHCTSYIEAFKATNKYATPSIWPIAVEAASWCLAALAIPTELTIMGRAAVAASC